MKYPTDLVVRIQPVQTLDENTLAAILQNCVGAPKSSYSAKDVKAIYDRIYLRSKELLFRKMEGYNSHRIVIEAFSQLQFWTAFYMHLDVEIHTNEEIFARIEPHARYVWQYIIEISSTKLMRNRDKYRIDLVESKLIEFFTLGFLMQSASAASNELHYFPEDHDQAVWNYMQVCAFAQQFNDETVEARVVQEAKYAMELLDGKYGRYLALTNNRVLGKVYEKFLISNFGFELGDFEKIALAVFELIDEHVLVDSFASIVNEVSIITGLPFLTAKRCLEFFLYDPTRHGGERDFLDRSEAYRMVNFAGILLPRTRILSSIFGPSVIGNAEILQADRYILISTLMLVEWQDRFLYRIVFDKAQYLYKQLEENQELGRLVQFYHRNIFEVEFDKDLKKFGFLTIRSLRKVDGRQLDCGEIDLIACDPKTSTYSMFELKAIFKTSDPKSKKQLHSDYLGSKDYHGKILRKKKWFESNTDTVARLISVRYSVVVSPPSSLEVVNITLFSNFLRFQIQDYKIMRFDEYLEMTERNLTSSST